MKLSEQEPGRRLRILVVAGPMDFVGRMHDVGLLPGAFVEILAKLPFQGALVLRLMSTSLAIRHQDADFFEVEPL